MSFSSLGHGFESRWEHFLFLVLTKNRTPGAGFEPAHLSTVAFEATAIPDYAILAIDLEFFLTIKI